MKRPHAPLPRRRRARRIALIGLAALCALFSFGFSEGDSAQFLGFSQAADRWQADPEFRAVAMEYSVRGSEAMRGRPFGVPAAQAIMAMRSAPGLPKQYAVNPTSALHYQRFAAGPLSAYLHLSGEQDIPPYLIEMEALAARPNLTDEHLRTWLATRQMDFPVARDNGAVQSLRSLLADVEAGRPFVVRRNVPPLLSLHITALASEIGSPSDPPAMTPAQQQAILDRLDARIRQADPQLWRTKQVNDFAAGLWAQTYAPVYRNILSPILIAHTASGALLVLLLAALLIRTVVLRRREQTAAEAARAGMVDPLVTAT